MKIASLNCNCPKPSFKMTYSDQLEEMDRKNTIDKRLDSIEAKLDKLDKIEAQIDTFSKTSHKEHELISNEVLGKGVSCFQEYHNKLFPWR